MNPNVNTINPAGSPTLIYTSARDLKGEDVYTDIDDVPLDDDVPPDEGDAGPEEES